jgi:hypothetical protein
MNFKTVITLLSVLTLAGCGGDSGSDSDAGPNTTASLAGLYLGSFTENPSGTNYDLAAIVAPNGKSYLMSFDGLRLYVGSLKGAGDVISGTVRAYDFVYANAFLVVATDAAESVSARGAFVPGDGASGSFNSNKGQAGTFSLNYLTAESEAGASFAQLEGRWAGSDEDSGESAYIDIAADGAYSGADSDGCSVSGQISIPDASVNVYTFTYQEVCPGLGSYSANGLMEVEQDDEDEVLIAALSGSGVAGVYLLTKEP